MDERIGTLMNPYDCRQAALRAVPGRIGQAAALLLAARLPLNAGWATAVTAIVTQRAGSVAHHMQDSLQDAFRVPGPAPRPAPKER